MDLSKENTNITMVDFDEFEGTSVYTAPVKSWYELGKMAEKAQVHDAEDVYDELIKHADDIVTCKAGFSQAGECVAGVINQNGYDTYIDALKAAAEGAGKRVGSNDFESVVAFGADKSKALETLHDVIDA